MKVINWDSNTVVRIQLWDIAGEFIFIKKSDRSCLYVFSYYGLSVLPLKLYTKFTFQQANKLFDWFN